MFYVGDMIHFIQFHNTSAFLNKNGLWGEVTNQKIWTSGQIHENKRILQTLAALEPQQKAEILAASHDQEAGEYSAYELEQRSVISHVQEELIIQLGLFRDWIKIYKLNQ